MELGIEWMIAVSLWVAKPPGRGRPYGGVRVGRASIGTAGLIVICLLRTPLRLAGVVLCVVAMRLAMRTPKPDVLVAASGDSIAVRGADGRLQVLKIGNDAFAIREWLAADGDARPAPATAAAREGFACDDDGCVARLGDGQRRRRDVAGGVRRRLRPRRAGGHHPGGAAGIAPRPCSTARRGARAGRWRCGAARKAGR